MIRKFAAIAAIAITAVSAVGISQAGADDVNPQPLPPRSALSVAAINPEIQPLVQLNWVTVNPQPLPPRVIRPVSR